MNRRTDNERLLAEVLADESGDGFREALLEETLRRVRHRRQWRRMRRIGGALALAVVIAIAVWPVARPVVAKREIARLPATSYHLVISQPLLPGQIVTTAPGSVEPVIASVTTMRVVHTLGGGYHEVGDDELLALAAPQTAALVRRGPHEAELVFLPPLAESAPQQN